MNILADIESAPHIPYDLLPCFIQIKKLFCIRWKHLPEKIENTVTKAVIQWRFWYMACKTENRQQNISFETPWSEKKATKVAWNKRIGIKRGYFSFNFSLKSTKTKILQEQTWLVKKTSAFRAQALQTLNLDNFKDASSDKIQVKTQTISL